MNREELIAWTASAVIVLLFVMAISVGLGLHER